MPENSEKKKKKPNIDKLTEDLDPDKINKEVEIPHITAHHKWLPKLEEKVSVDDYADFREQIIKYMQHHHKEIYKADMPDEQAFAKAHAILERFDDERGNKGFVGAYKSARQGRLGDVIKTLATFEELEHRKNYIENIFNQIDPLDWDSHVDFVKQYKSKYGQFLHKRIRQRSDEELAKDWRPLIEHHAMSVVPRAKAQLQKYEPKKKEYKTEKKEAA